MKLLFTLFLSLALHPALSHAGSIGERHFSDCHNLLVNQKFVSASENSTLMTRNPEIAREIQFKSIDKGIIGSYWMSKIVSEDSSIYQELYELGLTTAEKQARFLSGVESSTFRYNASQKIVSHINSLFYLDHDMLTADVLDSIVKFTHLSKKEVERQRKLLNEIFAKREWYEHFRSLIEDLVPQIYFSSEIIKETENSAVELQKAVHLYRPSTLAKVRQWTFSTFWTSMISGTAYSSLLSWLLISNDIIDLSLKNEVGALAMVNVLTFVVFGGLNALWISEEMSEDISKSRYRSLRLNEALEHPPVPHTGFNTPLTSAFNYYVIAQDKAINKLINFSRSFYGKWKSRKSRLSFERNRRLFKQHLLRLSPDNEYVEAVNKDIDIDGKYMEYTNEEQLEDVKKLISQISHEVENLNTETVSVEQIEVLQKASESATLALRGLTDLQESIKMSQFQPQLDTLALYNDPNQSGFKVHTEKLIEDLKKTTKNASEQALLAEKLSLLLSDLSGKSAQLADVARNSKAQSLVALLEGLSSSFAGPLTTANTEKLQNLQSTSTLAGNLLNRVVAIQVEGPSGQKLSIEDNSKEKK